ncbi:hypothetical protein ZOSMA_20G00440 [Zostera marina]|uniref:RRM domain-containing protein n=1 Tax=Zostera marina TaxID=29655 RepID=A0A0K9PKS1_ZOSMR|nr:hypothetical protein ZOSMA_20G00440 [Zostera marina]
MALGRGNLLKKALPSESPSLYQAMRCISSKIHVSGLQSATDSQGLKEAFTKFGEIMEARILPNRNTGKSKGSGFVSFTSSEEASAAISGMNGKDLQGQSIRVRYATVQPLSPLPKQPFPLSRMSSFHYVVMQYLKHRKNQIHFDPTVVLKRFVDVSSPRGAEWGKKQAGSNDLILMGLKNIHFTSPARVKKFTWKPR